MLGIMYPVCSLYYGISGKRAAADGKMDHEGACQL